MTATAAKLATVAATATSQPSQWTRTEVERETVTRRTPPPPRALD